VNFSSFAKLSTLSRGACDVRIPPWTPEAASRDPALVDAILKRRGGRLINLDRALLWSEPLAREWNAYVGAVRRELSVSPRLKELAICVVARITGAEYEFTHHWPEYVKAGGRDDLRPRMKDPDRAMQDADFSDDEKLAMRYAAAVTRTPKVPEALFEEVRRRFNPTELVELTAAIATYNMVARLLLALDIEPDAKPL
jgi:alkylhydroperoxidase family enzyme